MLVYGDHSETASPREVLDRLANDWLRLLEAPAGIETHAALVSLFIEVAQLGQGIADHAFDKRGYDLPSPADEAMMRLLVELAREIDHSWRHAFRLAGSPDVARRFGNVMAFRLAEAVSIKRPEGFAFYALYPDSYLRAAEALSASATVRVIGIRSIGVALAALVAAPLPAKLPVTVRPIGDPFRRDLSVAPELRNAILSDSPGIFGIADEGPGLSGSSFGAVADFLEREGIAAERIHFFPSHGNDLGPQASVSHRRRWRSSPRHMVDLESALIHPPRRWQRLSEWMGGLLGAPSVGNEPARLVDISGGAWRAHRYERPADWPPANLAQERRKFLLYYGDGKAVLAKFAGLGRYGESKLMRARLLSEAALIPEVLGLRYGFLAERWRADTRPLNFGAIDRKRLVDHLARYLGFRARHFGTGEQSGAPAAALGGMLRRNAALSLGPASRLAGEKVARELARLEGAMRRIATDNRLHAWEWLETADGLLIKSDALDHCEAHDLVGCQDVAWDVAGAVVEFGLSPGEQARLCAALADIAGHAICRDLLDCLKPCYLAFQAGAFTLASQALSALPDEAGRLSARAGHYVGLLRLSLAKFA